MSQQNKLMGTPTTAELPAKRKRGRPRKDNNLVNEKNSLLSAIPVSNIIQKTQQVDGEKVNDIDNNMVGQLVSGVVDGTFNAGYFLCVRIGNSSTLLRGVVFQPDQVTPITEANDVAPHVMSYKRRDVPMPVVNQQSQVNGSLLQQVQNIEQPVELEDQIPVVPDQVLPPELQAGGVFALNNQSESLIEPINNMPMNAGGSSLAGKFTAQQKPEFGFVNHSASVIVPVSNMSKVNDGGTSLRGGKVMQQQVLNFKFKNQSASSILPLTNMLNNVSGASNEVRKVTLQQTSGFGFENQSSPLLKNLKMVEQDEVMQVFEVPASEQMAGIFSCSKGSNQLAQDHYQADESELVLEPTPVVETQYLLPEPQTKEPEPSPTESVDKELRSSDLELHHIPEVSESQSVHVKSKYVDSGIKSSEFVHKKLENSNIELNQPSSGSMDVDMEKPISPPIYDDSSQYLQSERDSSKDGTSENGDPVNNVVEAIEAGPQPILRTEESVVPSKPADEESDFPRNPESQISNSSGHTTSMDFVCGDVIPATQSHC